MQWLELSEKGRYDYLIETSISKGIPPELLEKEWWQTFLLKALFELPSANYLTLHGSRSLTHI